MINKYPYTDFNEYNMDWIIKTVKDLTVQWAETHQEWSDVKTEWENYKNYIDNYFDNLDLSQEVSDKIDQMAADGYFSDLFNTLFRSDLISEAGSVTSAWIADNLLQETGYVIDNSLTVANAAADAKATGDAIANLKNASDAEVISTLLPFIMPDQSKLLGGYAFFAESATWLNSAEFTLEAGTTYQFCVLFSKSVVSPSLVRLYAGGTQLISGSATGNVKIFTYTPSTTMNNVRFNMVAHSASYPLSVMAYFGENGFADNLEDLSTQYLHSTYKLFSSVGDASALEVNQTYLVKGSDVVPGSNLPDGLSGELDGWPATITTITSSDVRGSQFIISSSNMFFRLITHNRKNVTDLGSNSTWRTIDYTDNIVRIVQSNINAALDQARYKLYADYETYYATVNGAYLKTKTEDNGMDCTPAGVYGAHNASIYGYNSKFYLGCAANKIDATEDQTKYNLELIITDLSGNIESHTAIVSVGDNIGGKTIQRCQAISFLPIDNIIHIYCDLYVDGKYKFYHVPYNITTALFGSFDEVSFINPSSVSTLAENNNEQYIAQSWFSYGGHDNCTAVYFNANNCGIAYTDDYTTFNFITRLDAPKMGAGGEITAYYVASLNIFIVAYRTLNNYPYLIFRQYDIPTSRWEDEHTLPDATARPMFFKYGNNIYLMNNAPYTRRDLTLWRYLTLNLDGVWNKAGTFECDGVAHLTTPCTYFSFTNYDSKVYMASIQNDLKKIVVSEVPINWISNNDIYQKLISDYS